MKLSMKQIIYGSLLAAAGVAWAIDAAFFGPPAAAHAAPPAPDSSTNAAAKPNAGEVAVGDGPEHLLTTRLQNWAVEHSTTLGEMSDVFQPPVAIKPVTVVVARPQTQPAEDPAVVFNRQHRLIAIVLDSGGGYALIDGRILRVGQAIGEEKLIGLSRGRARFISGDRMFEVPLTPDVGLDQ
jgi:hypothetical protein